ncbi:GtrA family protein [Saccharopolyspora sp. NPDC000359]|uniref:GtrA family protein n=1 Tax=Saccharopolyspora sp. NPDC000359 TaxID=3154251 RepID=UPI0033200B40
MSSNSTAEPRPHKGFFTQAFRFALVGAGGAVVDYGSLTALLALETWPELARILSFTIGSTAVYLVNRRWTFTSTRSRREVATLAVVLALTFALVAGVNALALRLLPQGPWQITLAWAISQAVATTFNFLAQRTVVFRQKTPNPATWPQNHHEDQNTPPHVPRHRSG